MLTTPRTTIRRLRPEDGDAVRAIRTSAEVARWWHPVEAAWPVSDKDADDPDEQRWVVDVDGTPKGLIQVYGWPDADYRYASIDVFLDESVHHIGLGREVIGVDGIDPRTW